MCLQHAQATAYMAAIVLQHPRVDNTLQHQRVWLHLYSAAVTAQAHHQKCDNINGAGLSMSSAL